MTEYASKSIRIINLIGKIAIVLIILCIVVFLISMLFGKYIEFPSGILFFIKWGTVISVIILIIVAIIEFFNAIKNK